MTDPTSASPSVAPSSASPPSGTSGGVTKERNASLWADAGRELLRNPAFVISAVVALMAISMAVVPWLWTSVDPRHCPLKLSKDRPGDDHFLGNTLQGCDMYAQAIYGARPTIQVAVLATAGVVLIGGVTGVLSGYYGRWLDAIISRLVDIFMGLPFLLGALTLLALVQSHSVWAVVGALITLGWPSVTRIMRASVIATRGMDYVQAARSLGASDARIIFRHVLPNAIAPVVVIATIALGGYVAAEATLTFLGVGLTPPEVSWGVMITQGQNYLMGAPAYPHMLLVPVSFLVATVLSFILMGDATRDALDPKLR
ncbi:MAG: ABC transporter permease [Micromonosporaceae bacterium]